MDQEELGELLSAYLDGELGVRDAEIVKELLRDNDDVRAQYESMRRTVSIVNSLPRHASPPALLEDIESQLERRDLLDDHDENGPTEPIRRFPWLPSLSTAAVIAAIAFVGFHQRNWWSPNATPTSHVARGDRTTDGVVSRLEHEGETKAKRAKLATTETASLQTMLAAGTTTDAVRTHSFSNETVRLKVAMTDSVTAAAAEKRMLSRLSGLGVLDVAAVHGSALSLTSGAFFLGGKPGVNFSDAGTRQVLVRIPAAALDGLLDEVAVASDNTEHITLTAGSLSFEGLSAARDTLLRHGVKYEARQVRAARRRTRHKGRLASRSSSREPSSHPQPDDATVVDIFKTLGIPKTALDKVGPPQPAPQANAGEIIAPAAEGGRPSFAPPHSTEYDKATVRANQPMIAGKMAVTNPQTTSEVTGAAGATPQVTTEPSRFVTLVVEFSSPSKTVRPPRATDAKPKAKDVSHLSRHRKTPAPSK